MHDIDLSNIENELKEKLSECEIWGDLGLSHDEYETLTQNIKDVLSKTNCDMKSYLYLLNNYPVTMVTQVINFILYNDENNFWDEWQESLKLNININNRPIIGSIWIKKIVRFGFDIFEDDGYKYITPLICQAGVPNNSLGNLFYIVENTENQYFDPREIIDDLFSWRKYLLNKPIERFIRLHRDSAINLILEINEIINNNNESISDEGNRIVEQYKKYKENESLRFNSRKRGINNYIVPHLFFDLNTKGLTIKLPQFPINNEYVRNLTWIIEGDTFQTSITVKTLITDSGRLSSEAFVLVPYQSAYNIKVYDDINEQKPLKVWENPIEGFSRDYIIFDNRGKRVSGEFLPKDSGYILYKYDKAKVKFNQMMKDDLYLPEMSNGLNAAIFYIANNSSSLEIQTSSIIHKISCRPTINVRLVSNYYLFDECGGKDRINTFTKFPFLEIKIDEFIDNNVLIVVKNIAGNYKQIYHLSDYTIKNEVGAIFVEINNESKNITMPYGIYEVSLYREKTFLQSLRFAYAPKILHDTKNTNLWPDDNSFMETTGFCYKPQKGIDILFRSKVKENLTLVKNETWKQVDIDENSRHIEGDLLINQNNQIIKIPFRKTVRNIIWKFWNEETEEERVCSGTEYFYDDEFINKNWWIVLDVNIDALQFPPTIEMKTKTNHISDIKFKNTGKANIPMLIFSTSLENSSFPIEILMHYSTDNINKSIVLADISEKVLLNDLKYRCDDKTKNKPVLMWSNVENGSVSSENKFELVKINDSAFSEEISLKNAKTNKSGTFEFIMLNNILTPGLYKLQRKETEDFFSDLKKYKPIEIGNENIFLLNKNDIVKGQYTLSHLIDITLCLHDNMEVLKMVKNVLGNNSNLIKDITLNVADIRNLICIACNFTINSKRAVEMNETINLILDILSEKYLTSKQRMEILIELLDSDTNQEQFDVCYQKFNLFLSHFASEVPNRERIDKLSSADNIACIIWLLQTQTKQYHTNFDNKILSTIGIESAKEMIRFSSNCEVCKKQQDWLSCYEKIINTDIVCANYAFIPSAKILGNTEDFINIIDWGKPGGKDEPKLFIQNKPDVGLEFCGKNYIDLLISWFYSYKQNVETLKPHIDSLKAQFIEIDKTISNFDIEIKNLIKVIVSSLQGRDIEGNVYEVFYYSGVSSIIAALYNRNMISDKQYVVAEKYLIIMKKVCPEIVDRDMLFAELYMYFKERGAK